MAQDFFMNGQNGVSLLIKNWDKSDEKFRSKLFLKQITNICNHRWNILSIAISIEMLINAHIEYIIFDEKNKNTVLFQDLFLRSNYLTFFSKWQILKELCKISEKVKKYYDKDVIIRIQECIELRNIFAHGKCFFDSNEDKFYIEFFKSHSIKIKELTYEYFQETVIKFYNAINDLNLLVYWDNSWTHTEKIAMEA